MGFLMVFACGVIGGAIGALLSPCTTPRKPNTHPASIRTYFNHISDSFQNLCDAIADPLIIILDRYDDFENKIFAPIERMIGTNLDASARAVFAVAPCLAVLSFACIPIPATNDIWGHLKLLAAVFTGLCLIGTAALTAVSSFKLRNKVKAHEKTSNGAIPDFKSASEGALDCLWLFLTMTILAKLKTDWTGLFVAMGVVALEVWHFMVTEHRNAARSLNITEKPEERETLLEALPKEEAKCTCRCTRLQTKCFDLEQENELGSRFIQQLLDEKLQEMHIAIHGGPIFTSTVGTSIRAGTGVEENESEDWCLVSDAGSAMER